MKEIKLDHEEADDTTCKVEIKEPSINNYNLIKGKMKE